MIELLYVYCIVPAAPPLSAPGRTRERRRPRGSGEGPQTRVGDDLAGLVGIGGAPVGLVAEGPIAAVVSAVPAEEFDEEPLNSRLRDLDWLSPRATAHQAVNARLMELDDALLPLSFGSVYRDEASLRRTLAARAEDFARRLGAVRGRAEWVVTLTRDEASALAALEQVSEALRRLSEEIAVSPPGRQYLLSRRLGTVRRQELANLDAEAIESTVLGLTGAVERVYREPLAEGAVGAPVARASVLVPRPRAAALLDEIGRLDRIWSARGYSLTATGPWPPYRFGGLDPD